jgi:hypothetical protein
VKQQQQQQKPLSNSLKNKETGNSYLQNETKFRFTYPSPPPPQGSFRHRSHHTHHVQQQKHLKEKEFQQNLTAKPLVSHHSRSRLQQHQQQQKTNRTPRKTDIKALKRKGDFSCLQFFSKQFLLPRHHKNRLSILLRDSTSSPC